MHGCRRARLPVRVTYTVALGCTRFGCSPRHSADIVTGMHCYRRLLVRVTGILEPVPVYTGILEPCITYSNRVHSIRYSCILYTVYTGMHGYRFEFDRP